MRYNEFQEASPRGVRLFGRVSGVLRSYPTIVAAGLAVALGTAEAKAAGVTRDIATNFMSTINTQMDDGDILQVPSESDITGYPLQFLPRQVLEGSLVFHEDDTAVMGDVSDGTYVGNDGAIGFLADTFDGGFRADGISGYPDQDRHDLARPAQLLQERAH